MCEAGIPETQEQAQDYRDGLISSHGFPVTPGGRKGTSQAPQEHLLTQALEREVPGAGGKTLWKGSARALEAELVPESIWVCKVRYNRKKRKCILKSHEEFP